MNIRIGRNRSKSGNVRFPLIQSTDTHINLLLHAVCFFEQSSQPKHTKGTTPIVVKREDDNDADDSSSSARDRDTKPRRGLYAMTDQARMVLKHPKLIGLAV